jgi:hypothetical protein
MNPMGHSAKDLKYRPQWTYPIVISPHDPKTLYVGSNVLFRTTNDGDSFEAISPDLTRNDPRTARPFGRTDHEGPDQRRVLRNGLHGERIAGREGGHLDRVR